MGESKSIAFAKSSSICGEESGWSEGLGRVSCRDVLGHGCEGYHLGLAVTLYLTCHWVMRYGHLQRPWGGKIQLGSPVYTQGQVCLFWRGCQIHLSVKGQTQRVPRAFFWAQGWILLVVWPSLSPKPLACQGWVHPLVLPLWVSVTRAYLQVQESWGPALQHPTYQDLVDLPPQVWGWGICRALALFHRAPQ